MKPELVKLLNDNGVTIRREWTDATGWPAMEVEATVSGHRVRSSFANSPEVSEEKRVRRIFRHIGIKVEVPRATS